LPEAGLKTIVLDGSGDPLCIVETTEVEVRPYDEVDARFAYEEGGGSFASVLARGALALLLAHATEHRQKHRQRTGNGDAAGVRAVLGGVQVVCRRRDTISWADDPDLEQRGF
jgi:hypothetical protein